MISRAYGATLIGIDPALVTVEVDLKRGLPKFELVGLAQPAVQEGRNRIKSALEHAGASLKSERITVNLAPAGVYKNGAALDLPIALALLSAMGHIQQSLLEETMALGELSLDGTLRPVRGALNIASHFSRLGWKRLIVPFESSAEASQVKEVKVLAPKTLLQLLHYFQEGGELPSLRSRPHTDPYAENLEDWSDVGGQALAKRAMEIAVSGHHNILLSGPPGIGKSLLASRLPSVLPPLGTEEAFEVARIQSVAGEERSSFDPVCSPFRAPHHLASLGGLIGGGKPFRPGDFSLAHQGVLFLDELPEFRRDAIEALREPLEKGVITVSRSEGTFALPARFLLIGAMNLCPCGYAGDESKICLCSPPEVRRYIRRVSGPIRDRIDLWVTLSRPTLREVLSEGSGEKSAVVRKRVEEARSIQFERNGPGKFNGFLSPKDLKDMAPLDRMAEQFLEKAAEKFMLSARGIHKVLAVARTIADMEGKERVGAEQIAEAATYRQDLLSNL